MCRNILFIGVLSLWFNIYLDAQIAFQQVEAIMGINHTYLVGGSASGGISLCDFNGDGWDDITLSTGIGEELHFYENNGNGFSKISPSLINTTDEHKQVLWVDYDNDGDKDLFVAAVYAPNRLYQNDGNLNLTEVTESAGLPLDSLRTFGASFGDYDRDGWLDLYVTNQPDTINVNVKSRLYRNLGNGSFVEQTEESGTGIGKIPFCASFVDVNNDDWPDIYIAQDRSKGNTLLKNNGDGTFEDISESSGANVAINAMCVAVGDYDGNGYFDIYVSNTEEGNVLLQNNGDETFDEVAAVSGTGFYNISWGANFADLDNDSDVDLYVSGMVPGTEALSSACYQNNGDGSFVLADGAGMEADTVTSFSNAVGDVNNDGFPDIMVLNRTDLSMLWENEGNDSNWLKVKLQGVESNRDGIGSKIEVYVNGQSYIRYTFSGIGFLAQNSATEMFGLGENESIDSLKVKWPSGQIDNFYNIESKQNITIIEGEEEFIFTGLAVQKQINFSCQIMPNPAKDNIQIIVEEMPYDFSMEWELVDVLGQVKRVYGQTNLTEKLMINVADLTAGMYFLTAKNALNQTIWVEKIVISD